MEHEKKTMVAQSTDDLTSGLKRLSAVKIDLPPYATIKKTTITFKWCMVDEKYVVITIGEHGQTLKRRRHFPFNTPSSGRNRQSAINDH
jgi:hypothetical protein